MLKYNECFNKFGKFNRLKIMKPLPDPFLQLIELQDNRVICGNMLGRANISVHNKNALFAHKPKAHLRKQ